MGAIGEQLGVAYAFEQDVQRFTATAEGRPPEYQRMMQRALAEASGYYILGASHSLGNLIARLLLLNEAAAAVLTDKYADANGFPPLSDEKEAWVSLGQTLSRALGKAGRDSGNDSMLAAVEAVRALERSAGFRNLEKRRGMDYHRRRPQSVEHASPRRPVIVREEHHTVMTSFGAQLEPEADADEVHRVVIEALEELTTSMVKVRAAIPDAIRSEGITFVSA